MSRYWTLFAAIGIGLALAGCHEKTIDKVDGEDGDEEEEPSFVTGVTVLSAPNGAAPGSLPEVCWSVEGGGTVAHTAIHWSDMPQNATSATFQDYSAGIMYPDNRTAPASGGYELTETFCTAFTMPDQDVYLIAHAIGARDGPPGLISTERVIRVAG